MPVAGPTLLALASALAYGAGDFVGGRAATRLPTLATLLVAQLAACALAIAVASGLGIGPVPPLALLLGAIAGLSHVAAVGLLYHGLAHGRITVVAPLSGVLNIVLPVFVDGVVLNGLSVLQGLGILLSGVAVCLVTRGTGDAERAPSSLKLSIGLGMASGLLFGTADLALGSVDASAAGDAVMVARLVGATGVLLAVLAVYGRRIAALIYGLFRAATQPALGLPGVPGNACQAAVECNRGTVAVGVAMALFAGMTDCLGHLAYVMSAATGELSIAVATSALFPAVSVLLAIIVLKEGIGRLQSLGLGVSAGAVALLAVA